MSDWVIAYHIRTIAPLAHIPSICLRSESNQLVEDNESNHQPIPVAQTHSNLCLYSCVRGVFVSASLSRQNDRHESHRLNAFLSNFDKHTHCTAWHTPSGRDRIDRYILIRRPWSARFEEAWHIASHAPLIIIWLECVCVCVVGVCTCECHPVYRGQLRHIHRMSGRGLMASNCALSAATGLLAASLCVAESTHNKTKT